VYCHYPREVVRIPEPREDRVVIFLDGSGVEGQPPKAGAAAVRVKGVGQETESVVDKMVYRASHGEVQAVGDVIGKIGEGVREVWMVVDAEADMASLRRLASRPLHEALGTGLALQVYAIWHGLEMKKVPLRGRDQPEAPSELGPAPVGLWQLWICWRQCTGADTALHRGPHVSQAAGPSGTCPLCGQRRGACPICWSGSSPLHLISTPSE